MFMNGRPQTVFQSGRRPAGSRRATAGPGKTGSGKEEILNASLHPDFPESISVTVDLQKDRRGRPSILIPSLILQRSFMRRATVRYSIMSIGPVKLRP